MKTHEEIKKGLECCTNESFVCNEECPYFNSLSNGVDCSMKLHEDAVVYIQQLEAQVPKWISAEDELPEEPCAVLVVLRGNAVGVAWYCKKYFETGSGLRFSAGNGITHWMPLPEPPKEE